MNDTERVLGRLEEFQKNSEKRFDEITDRFEKMDEKLDALNEFKWRMAGGAIVMGLALSGLIELIQWVREWGNG